MNRPINSYKICIVGDGGVGKTTYIERMKTGEFIKKYNPTIGSEVRALQFYTNKDKYNINLWDCAGLPQFKGLGKSYFIGAHAFILMFDLTNKASYQNLFNHYTRIKSVCPDSPIVLCGNKVDCGHLAVKQHSITFHRKRNLQYFDISAMSNYNFEKPFLYLLRKLTDDPFLHFVEAPAVLPPVVNIDMPVLVPVKTPAATIPKEDNAFFTSKDINVKDRPHDLKGAIELWKKHTASKTPVINKDQILNVNDTIKLYEDISTSGMLNYYNCVLFSTDPEKIKAVYKIWKEKISILNMLREYRSNGHILSKDFDVYSDLGELMDEYMQIRSDMENKGSEHYVPHSKVKKIAASLDKRYEMYKKLIQLKNSGIELSTKYLPDSKYLNMKIEYDIQNKLLQKTNTKTKVKPFLHSTLSSSISIKKYKPKVKSAKLKFGINTKKRTRVSYVDDRLFVDFDNSISNTDVGNNDKWESDLPVLTGINTESKESEVEIPIVAQCEQWVSDLPVLTSTDLSLNQLSLDQLSLSKNEIDVPNLKIVISEPESLLTESVSPTSSFETVSPVSSDDEDWIKLP